MFFWIFVYFVFNRAGAGNYQEWQQKSLSIRPWESGERVSQFQYQYFCVQKNYGGQDISKT